MIFSMLRTVLLHCFFNLSTAHFACMDVMTKHFFSIVKYGFGTLAMMTSFCTFGSTDIFYKIGHSP